MVKRSEKRAAAGSGLPVEPVWPLYWQLYFARGREQRLYRPLTAGEIEILEHNRNRAESWELVAVSEGFRPDRVHDCSFRGRVYIGALGDGCLEHEALSLPVGLAMSGFKNCMLGDDVAIQRVGYLADSIVGDQAILFDIGELDASTSPAGGEAGSPLWLEVGNENGGRRIQAASGLLPADACLWSRFRDDAVLQNRLEELSARSRAGEAGAASLVGDRSLIAHCRLIRDTRIGSHCSVQGANELRNLTVCSDSREPTVIGSGVELVNGIVGFGNSIVRGVKAIDFQTGRNVSLNNGARVLNTYLGANSTVSCCEILSNLIFPFHEQHHNNSFLIASTLMGQSNLSAGTTIGSNHNSRAADGEILAGRGFWPGLSVSLKHNSRFASFTLLATGAYTRELDIRLPFSLVNAAEDGAVEIMPGYWFRYNMYALERNARKFARRDRRAVKTQHIEFDYLAPDTAGEMLAALKLLSAALGLAPGDSFPGGTGAQGEEDPPILLEGLAAHHPARIIKPRQACRLYRRMLIYYGARELKKALERAGEDACRTDPGEAVRRLCGNPPRVWHNLGGQLIAEEALEVILKQVRDGSLSGYDELHAAYDRAWQAYPEQKTRHALYCLCEAGGIDPDTLSNERITEILENSLSTAESLFSEALCSRRKDYENPFRAITYRSGEEMLQVVGDLDQNDFLAGFRRETEAYCAETRKLVGTIKQRKET
jgi:hypothetical protein